MAPAAIALTDIVRVDADDGAARADEERNASLGKLPAQLVIAIFVGVSHPSIIPLSPERCTTA